MYYDIEEVKYLDNYKIFIKFKNGEEGTLDLYNTIKKGGVFSQLKKIAFFKMVTVDPEWRCLCWPNGVDLDPELVYYETTGKEIEIVRRDTKRVKAS